MEEALNALLHALRPYQPQRIILFGSTARGEADADSDPFILRALEEAQVMYEARS